MKTDKVAASKSLQPKVQNVMEDHRELMESDKDLGEERTTQDLIQ